MAEQKTGIGKHAIDFANAGLAVIPIRADGSKAPAISGWKSYQQEPPTEQQLRAWFSGQHRNAGAAVICGAVSGGLEVLDFDYDAEEIFPAWVKLIEHIAIRLPVVETPGSGYHVFYRCNVICGNAKIANTETGDVFIESRGEGGYVVACISPAEVHQLNYPYVQTAGPVLPEIPVITPDERKALWQAAATFDRSKMREQAVAKLVRKSAPRPKRQHDGKLTPWDDFNHRGDWYEVLQRHQWSSADGTHWRHPDAKSNHGHSATLRQANNGEHVLHVFTTSTPLESEKSHSLYSVFATLDHGGNFSEAAKELRGSGYGN